MASYPGKKFTPTTGSNASTGAINITPFDSENTANAKGSSIHSSATVKLQEKYKTVGKRRKK